MHGEVNAILENLLKIRTGEGSIDLNTPDKTSIHTQTHNATLAVVKFLVHLAVVNSPICTHHGVMNASTCTYFGLIPALVWGGPIFGR